MLSKFLTFIKGGFDRISKVECLCASVQSPPPNSHFWYLPRPSTSSSYPLSYRSKTATSEQQQQQQPKNRLSSLCLILQITVFSCLSYSFPFEFTFVLFNSVFLIVARVLHKSRRYTDENTAHDENQIKQIDNERDIQI